ncbi:MAG: YcxB family protein [Roseburia sp.]|nr:YcxB family protein [Roseburia sp.]MCM1098992.1 YcxB family protein [Ruminococcus flavefaciens]
METLFECEYTVDKKKYISWGRERLLHSPQLTFSIFWCAFAALILVVVIFTRMRLLLWFFLYALYRGLLRWILILERQYRLLANQYHAESWTRKYTLTDEGITLQEGNISINTPYSEVERIEEKADCLLLHLKDKGCFRLYRDCFVKGTWEECRDYLAWQQV